jgi:hypothetical protein
VYSPAQLAGISNVTGYASGGGANGAIACYRLKLPAGTDIRDATNFAYTDLVEIDGFSEPLVVVLVYDVAFGFSNEYRVALLSRTPHVSGAHWALLPNQGDTPQP